MSGGSDRLQRGRDSGREARRRWLDSWSSRWWAREEKRNSHLLFPYSILSKLPVNYETSVRRFVPVTMVAGCEGETDFSHGGGASSSASFLALLLPPSLQPTLTPSPPLSLRGSLDGPARLPHLLHRPRLFLPRSQLPSLARVGERPARREQALPWPALKVRPSLNNEQRRRRPPAQLHHDVLFLHRPVGDRPPPRHETRHGFSR